MCEASRQFRLCQHEPEGAMHPSATLLVIVLLTDIPPIDRQRAEVTGEVCQTVSELSSPFSISKGCKTDGAKANGSAENRDNCQSACEGYDD